MDKVDVYLDNVNAIEEHSRWQKILHYKVNAIKVIMIALAVAYMLLLNLKINQLEKLTSQQSQDIRHSVQVSYDLYHALKDN